MNDKAAVVGWYQAQIRQHGPGYRSLGYNHRSSQLRRFEAMLALGELDGARLLDAGCGFGDFLRFLNGRGVRPIYTGLEISPEMVDHCRGNFRAQLGPACGFQAADVLEYEPGGRFDYVVACGLFGLKTAGVERRIRPTMEKLFAWAGKGLAVNFLSSRAATQDPRSFYADPERMLAIALSLTPGVRLDHNYLPNDFTLYLYKTPGWRKSAEPVSPGGPS